VRPVFFCSFLLAPVLSQRLEHGPISISAFSAPSFVWVQCLGQIWRHGIQHPKIAVGSWFLPLLIIPYHFSLVRFIVFMSLWSPTRTTAQAFIFFLPGAF
jgi:hypothetical protein